MGGFKPHKFSNGVSARCVTFFCIASFLCGVLVVNRLVPLFVFESLKKLAPLLGSGYLRKAHETPLSISPIVFQAIPESVTVESRSLLPKQNEIQNQPLINCENKEQEASLQARDIFSQVSHTHNVIMKLDKSMSSLEMQLAAARASKVHDEVSTPTTTTKGIEQQKDRPKIFFFMGIMTAFSSRKRRNSIRETWMPQGERLKKLEKEKGIVVRFVIGHSSSPGGVLDRVLDVEEAQYKDFFRLDHAEGYHELSSKTKIYFSTAVAKWDADFYVKVDDDVHVNLGLVVSALVRQRLKSHVYIGCMKSGFVLSQKGVKYHEPEFWKFGEEGNKYFRHASGQIYAISKDLATYISVNKDVLHRYANEDVSLGSWLIGLDVNHIDDRSLCCGTPLDCEWKAQAGNPCAASFDWRCSGLCRSVERMEEIHQRCGEGDGAIWHASF